MNLIIMENLNIFLLFKFLFLIFIYLFLIFFWKISNKNFFKKYNSIQRIHDGEIPRLGGVISFLSITFCVFVNHDNNEILSKILLISFIPIFVVSLKDDIFHNASPKYKLVSMIFSLVLFFLLFPIDLPELNFFINDILVKDSFLLKIFFLFSCIIVINGNNFIDGSNGLMASTNLIQLLALLYLFNSQADENIVRTIIFIIFPLVVFLVYNYPFGKVFMGDLGAYFYGFMISLLVVIYFGKYTDTNPLAAVLLLIYPCYELLFTFIRKIINKFNPFMPDDYHLHSVIFKMLNNKNNLAKNSLILPILFPLWFLPPILSVIFVNNLLGLVISIMLVVVFYNILYIFFKARI